MAVLRNAVSKCYTQTCSMHMQIYETLIKAAAGISKIFVLGYCFNWGFPSDRIFILFASSPEVRENIFKVKWNC